MAYKPYKDKSFLEYHYIKKRKNVKDILEIMDKEYNCKVSHQTVNNWLEKYGLLKKRGKGRNLSSNLGRKKVTRKKSPFHEAQKRHQRRKKR